MPPDADLLHKVLGADRGTHPPRSGWHSVLQRHPVSAMLLWFFSVGQLIAFFPVVVRPGGQQLPTQPFIIASTLIGLLLPTVVITRVVDGQEGLRELRSRVVGRRPRLWWFAFAFALVPLVALSIAIALFGPLHGSGSVAAALIWGLVLPTAYGLLTNNLWEEVAWMGFVQTRLQARHGALRAALLTAPLFAVQHAPLVVGNSPTAALTVLVALIVLAVPFRAVMGWLDNTSGSLLAVGLVHASGNALADGGVFGDGLLEWAYPDRAIGPLHLFAFAAIGIVLIVATRARLGHNQSTKVS
jgi:membrane protease YdiL (CAAX protease family)